MAKNSSSLGDSLKSTFAAIVVPLEIVLAFIIYFYVLGDPQNFENGDPTGHPITEGWRSWLGVIYKGRVVVAVLIALLLMVLTFGIERMVTISSATGRGSIKNFVSRIRSLLSSNNINQA